MSSKWALPLPAISAILIKLLASFGFQDGISQPLLREINLINALETCSYMETDQNIIIVNKDSSGTQNDMKGDFNKRPK